MDLCLMNTTTDKNIITTYNGIEIYNDDISVLCKEYESQFDDIENRINKPMFFTGLVAYLYTNYFRPITEKSFNYDYKALDEIFYKIFLPICTRYQRTITLQNFCLMTGIHNSFLSQVLTGTHTDGSRVNPETVETVKKWKSTAESALVDNGISGNPVFSIFALKANHGWKETPQEIVVNGSATNATPEQIAERYKDVKQPELPDLG